MAIVYKTNRKCGRWSIKTSAPENRDVNDHKRYASISKHSFDIVGIPSISNHSFDIETKKRLQIYPFHNEKKNKNTNEENMYVVLFSIRGEKF